MEQRITLVTGVSKGIGRAVADHLTEQGHHIVGIARSAPGAGYKGDFFAADLGDERETADVLRQVTAKYAVDNLVNNAGIAKIATLEQATLEAFDAMVALNLRALLQCTQAVLPAMKSKHRGRIVNLGSRAALGKEGRSLYGGTKAAVVGFTRTWALELARDGITVNCIAPGPIETELFIAGNPPGSPQADALIASIPVGRIGKPRDVAAACAYLVSDDAGFVTGQVLNLCGGLTVGLAPV